MSRIPTVIVTEILLVAALLAFVGAIFVVERSLGLSAALELSPLGAMALSSVPALLWLAYFYVQDRHEPEPKHLVFGVYLIGCFMAGPLAGTLISGLTLPTLFAPLAVSPLRPDNLVRTFLVVALAQELCKYITVRYTIYVSAEFDEPMDGLVYMTAAGIGFAAWENYRFLQDVDRSIFLAVGAGRCVVTTLAHACFAGVMGFALGYAKFSKRSFAFRALILFGALVFAVILNGLFQLVESVMIAIGMEVTPWRSLAYSAGFAAVVFLVTSGLTYHLLAISPYRRSQSTEGHDEDQGGPEA